MQTKNPGRKLSASPSPCCRSGKCRECLESVRWDRLFQQNFVDPYYYSRRPVVWPITPLASAFMR
jgi:hypothetical protein